MKDNIMQDHEYSVYSYDGIKIGKAIDFHGTEVEVYGIFLNRSGEQYKPYFVRTPNNGTRYYGREHFKYSNMDIVNDFDEDWRFPIKADFLYHCYLLREEVITKLILDMLNESRSDSEIKRILKSLKKSLKDRKFIP